MSEAKVSRRELSDEIAAVLLLSDSNGEESSPMKKMSRFFRMEKGSGERTQKNLIDEE